MQFKFTFGTASGLLKHGASKINQDRHAVYKRVLGYRRVHAFAVFDGHGEFGHEVAELCANQFHPVLEDFVRDLPVPTLCSPKTTVDDDLHQQVADGLRRACARLEATVFDVLGSKADLSGTTALIAVLFRRHLFVANVGDSRAALVSMHPEASVKQMLIDHLRAYRAWTPSKQLERTRTTSADDLLGIYMRFRHLIHTTLSSPASTVDDAAAKLIQDLAPTELERSVSSESDRHVAFATWINPEHKPDAPEERQRILSAGGIIRPSFSPVTLGFVGPNRVWSKSLRGLGPGLNMSRSIGDKKATEIGVISNPVVFHNLLRGDTTVALILGTDGLWDVASPDDVLQILASNSEFTPAIVERILNMASRAWRRKGIPQDDITCGVIRFTS